MNDARSVSEAQAIKRALEDAFYAGVAAGMRAVAAEYTVAIDRVVDKEWRPSDSPSAAVDRAIAGWRTRNEKEGRTPDAVQVALERLVAGGYEQRRDDRRYPPEGFRRTKALKFFEARGLPLERPNEMIERRWGILQRYVLDGLTLEEVGREYGVTKEGAAAQVDAAIRFFRERPDA